MAKRERLRLEDALIDATPKHRFKKGDPRPEGAGRQKGSKNKLTVLLKDAILQAAELEGSDRHGKGGLVGFLRMYSRKHPVVYGRLMEKLLPYQLTGKDGSPMQVVHTTKQQLLDRMKEKGLPLPQSLLEMPVHSNAKN